MDKQESTQPTPSELLEIFPEAIPIIKQKLREYKAWMNEVEPDLKDGLFLWMTYFHSHPDDPWVEQWGIEKAIETMKVMVYDHYVNHTQKHIKRLEHLLKIHEWKRKPQSDSSISDMDIARAKTFPIRDIIAPNKAGFIVCPFHSEKHGSCKIHKDNRYHCYGCGADGDVIDLMMKLNNLDFINAVKKILGK